MKKNIALIMVAYKAVHTLEEFYKTLPTHLFDAIILVDDASGDGTFERARALGIESYRNEKNLGYGGNLKRALSIALEKGADVIVDIHPDGEYKSSAIEPALRKIEEGASLVLGNRFYKARQPLESGMYSWKYIPITVMNLIAKWGLWIPCNDVHQGFRVYTKELLERVPFERNSNNYLFSFEIIAQTKYAGLPMAEVPVDTNYTGEKRGASLRNSISYSLAVFGVLAQYYWTCLGVPMRLFKIDLI